MYEGIVQDLIDQFGQRRTAEDFKGKTYALFFGYASCEAICSAVLPDIANAMDVLDQEGSPVETVMISIDPARAGRLCVFLLLTL